MLKELSINSADLNSADLNCFKIEIVKSDRGEKVFEFFKWVDEKAAKEIIHIIKRNESENSKCSKRKRNS